MAEHAGAHIQLAWTQSEEEKAAIEARVSALLREPLTVNSAVQIAVLNNPVLRSTWTEIQLSEADVLAASRLANPTLAASLRWPDSHPRGPDAEFSFAADLLNGLLIPLRRHYAEREVSVAQARAADAVLRLIIEVKKTLVTLEAHQLLHARIAEVL
ncbi:MAG TPA: TolC family protein, partial [Opitutaceae bacterium]